jgi:HSP20 family molecular chaperone IbpA
MSLTRRAPRTSLTDLALLQRGVNQIFERLAGFDRADRPAAGEWFPSVDVYECRGTVTVVVEVPGLPPESVRVVYRDHCLIITGERRERRPAGGVAAFLCMERPQGRFTRTIPVDLAVDIQNAEACLEGGLLFVFIPRLKERRGRETLIHVKREEGS